MTAVRILEQRKQLLYYSMTVGTQHVDNIATDCLMYYQHVVWDAD